MRIGILTLPLHTNYGGIIQAYALQTILERMGHEVIIFNTETQYPVFHPRSLVKRIIRKIKGEDVILFSEFRYRKEAPTLNQYVWNSRKRLLHEEIIKSLDDIHEKDINAIIVGSDQVLRPIFFKPMWKTGIENAFLNFTKGWKIKRMAYAASLGVDIWEQSSQETLLCKQAIRLFDYFSVREESGINLIKQYLDIDVCQVLDPTMLLTAEDYEKVFETEKQTSICGTLLSYTLDNSNEMRNFINQIAKDKNLKPFSINNSLVKQTAPIEQRIRPSVETWLRGFYNAKLVVTDSFHACVFSILFGKPFIVIGNVSRGMSRFSSLLKMFDLENNLIGNFKDYRKEYNYAITESSKQKLEAWRKKSIDFLKQINY